MFYRRKKHDSAPQNMFGTSGEELAEMVRRDYIITICSDSIKIDECLYKPSVAYPSKLIPAEEIQSVDINGYPPAIQTGDELIFAGAGEKEALKLFAERNGIPVVNREDIWSWILEPFLDTEYTARTALWCTQMLAQYGLDEEKVASLRKEVEEQMLKYNFDTAIWEWVNLNLYDVLKAMRTKYNDEMFADFYRRAMHIALLQKIK